MSTYVGCSKCGKRVSNDTGVDIVVRALVECPECIERTPDVVESAPSAPTNTCSPEILRLLKVAKSDCAQRNWEKLSLLLDKIDAKLRASA